MPRHATAHATAHAMAMRRRDGASAWGAWRVRTFSTFFVVSAMRASTVFSEARWMAAVMNGYMAATASTAGIGYDGTRAASQRSGHSSASSPS